MRAYQREGLSAAEAARLASADADDSGAETAARPDRSVLARALERFDEPGAQEAFDRLLALVSLDALLRDFVIPYLADLGERCEARSASVGQEHFASNVLRGRLLGLARGWGQGVGPLAVLACAPGEQHDLGLVSFGLALRARGWRIAFLGPDTPMGTLIETTDLLGPQLVVVSATAPQRLSRVRDELTALGRAAPLALAGAGARPALAEAVAAKLMAGDPVTEAEAWASGDRP
jgi:methanogenic corrinoid protein MtbC1